MFATQIFTRMLPAEIVNQICSFLTIAETKQVIGASSQLEDAIHESTYKNAVLREHPTADLFKRSWMSWKDLVLNIELYSKLWSPDKDLSDEYHDEYRDDSSGNHEQRWAEEHAVNFWVDDL